MRDRGPYAKVVRAFWTDPEIRALPGGQQRLLLYYISAPQGNMAGLYYQPFELTARDLRLSVTSVKRWTLHFLSTWVTYDLATAEVLVHNAARYAVDKGASEPLLETDNRHKGMLKQVLAAHSLKLRRRFAELYADWPVGRAVNGAPKGLRSPSPNQ
jgi:hypothetical protein